MKRKILVLGGMAIVAGLATVAIFSTGCAMLSEDTLATLKEKAIAELKTNGAAKAKDMVEQAVADGKITQAQADLLNQAIDAGAEKLENINAGE